MRWKVCERLRPSGADHHPHRERAARLARHQRAEIVGDAFRQHRHYAVREIDGIAAHQRIAVERRTGPDVECDIGDRDVDDEAAFVVRIGILFGVNRVVVVLRIRRVDGDERHVAPVLAPLQVRRLGFLGLAQCVS